MSTKKKTKTRDGVVKKSVSLPTDLCQQAEAKAKEGGESFSFYVRKAVRKELGLEAA
jgi:metal-responsive CopG/Arc/MetJ family transcriptional regulator